MKQQLFTVYNQRCAGYLLMNGFPLVKMAQDINTGMNSFIFANTAELHEWIDKWKAEQTQKEQNK